MTKKKVKPQEIVSVEEDAEMAKLRAAKKADMVIESSYGQERK